MDCYFFKPSSELRTYSIINIFSGPNGVFIMDVPLYIVLYLLFIMLIIMLVELGTDRHIDLKDGTITL